ncbi:MAG: hypothetical protein LBT34_02915 [Clostridiales Family XIII bacterium]|nr:hypothetical protein [Clostridiales Family XIII bacterium]
MEIISIYIYDEDPFFAEALGNRIACLYRGFSVTLGKDLSIIRNPEQAAKYDFILAGLTEDREVSRGELGRTAGAVSEKIILMSENPASGGLSGKEKSIYKYRGTSELVSDLRYLYAENKGGAMLTAEPENTVHVACCGTRGGAGVTSVAIATGRELARHHGKRCLYLCFDEVESDIYCLPKADNPRNIGDYLFQTFKGRRRESMAFFESFMAVDSYSLERFYPSPGRNDLAELDESELSCFFQSIWNSSRYDYIILDIGGGQASLRRTAIAFSDVLVMVNAECGADTGKADKTAALIEEMWAQNGKRTGIIRIKNMTGYEEEWDETDVADTRRAGLRPGADSGKEPAAADIIEIGFDAKSFQGSGGRPEISMSNVFGTGIMELAERLLG